MSSELGPRPSKRSRDDSSNELVIIKHDSVYYANGDIVLLSLPKEDHVVIAFKVDKVFLSRYSPVFEGMLCLPLTDNVEKYDGVPLVHLQDKAEDLGTFLAALYNPMTVPSKKHNPQTMKKVKGMLQLSEKYQVDSLHTRIVAIVSADWPSTLSSWDANEVEIKHLKQEHGVGIVDEDDYCDDYGEIVLPDPCEAIRFAHEHDIKSMLPAAFYQLSRMPTHADPDDPDLKHNDELESYHRVHVRWEGRVARFSLLSSHDFLCLLRGITSMSQVAKDCVRVARDKTPSTCTAKAPEGRKRCMDIKHKFLLDICESQEQFSAYPSPDPLKSLLREDFEKSGVYGTCSSLFSDELQKQRSVLWNKLSEIFRLDTMNSALPMELGKQHVIID